MHQVAEAAAAAAPSRNNGATRAIPCSLRRHVAERSVGGWRPDRVCSSVCLHDAFHVPRISLPFISPPPPLCRFRVRVLPASRISLQLVLVQILIPKGWLGRWWGWRRLTSLASEKTRGRSGRSRSAPAGWTLLSSLFTSQLRHRGVLRESPTCRGVEQQAAADTDAGTD